MTGGGTAGHVTPNLALIPELRERGFEVHYIGRKTGIEKDLIEATGISYHSISAGKLRRYFDLKNLTDLFRIGVGFLSALILLKRIRPQIVFSKGGFVCCPVYCHTGELGGKAGVILGIPTKTGCFLVGGDTDSHQLIFR